VKLSYFVTLETEIEISEQILKEWNLDGSDFGFGVPE